MLCSCFRVFVVLASWFVFFSLRRCHCMTLNQCSLNPEVFESPFYSEPAVKFDIV